MPKYINVCVPDDVRGFVAVSPGKTLLFAGEKYDESSLYAFLLQSAFETIPRQMSDDYLAKFAAFQMLQRDKLEQR